MRDASRRSITSEPQPGHICPKCFSEDVRRAHRQTFLDGLVRLFGWRVYRCQECRARFYDRPTQRARP
jgi:hypothetical protein